MVRNLHKRIAYKKRLDTFIWIITIGLLLWLIRSAYKSITKCQWRPLISSRQPFTSQHLWIGGIWVAFVIRRGCEIELPCKDLFMHSFNNPTRQTTIRLIRIPSIWVHDALLIRPDICQNHPGTIHFPVLLTVYLRVDAGRLESSRWSHIIPRGGYIVKVNIHHIRPHGNFSALRRWAWHRIPFNHWIYMIVISG